MGEGSAGPVVTPPESNARGKKLALPLINTNDTNANNNI